ncbi:uncharacterized protein JCM6883_006962 [Sporobolomyces salmoneus]|uniref:uncharacterized protein n=1 Tax=Sporobolomyces salmoneus TaxID=183962 RepID=UPI003170A981
MITRTVLRTVPRVRYSSSSANPPPPPKGSFFSASAIYPFLLLSAITSLALNLSHQRTAKSQETAHLSAQITVLESLLAQLRSTSSSPPSSEEIERELELVGLGRGKGKKALGEGDKLGKSMTSWTEVLFGKKGKEFQQDKDDTDWEKVFREADEAEIKKSNSSNSSENKTLPTPVLVTPPPSQSSPQPPPATSPSATDPTTPSSSKPKSTAIYL